MADKPAVKTKPLTRDVLDAIAKGNPRAVKALENLSDDVQVTLPDAISGLTEESQTVLSGSVFLPRPPVAPIRPAGSSDADAVLAGEAFRRRAAPLAPVAQDGSDANQVLAGDMFRRRNPVALVIGAEANAGAILATQIFGG